MSYKSSQGSSVLTQLNRKHQKDIHSIKPCFKLEYARETFTQTKRSETEAKPASKQPHTVSFTCFSATQTLTLGACPPWSCLDSVTDPLFVFLYLI